MRPGSSEARRPAAHLRWAIAIGVAVLAIVVYVNAIRPNLVPKNFGTVDDGRVYRSGQLTPAAMRAVHDKYHIKTVVDLGSYPEGSRGDERNQQVAAALGMTRYRMRLEGDSTGNPNYYVQALKIMLDPAKQPVLVHCGAGSERTGYAAMVYDLYVRGTPIDEGLKNARKFRHNPRRNPHLEETAHVWTEPILKAYRTGTAVQGAEPLPPAKAVTRSQAGP